MIPLKQSIRRMFGGRFRAGSYSAAASVAVILIAVVTNMMVSALPSSVTQLDLTSQSLYSLSDQTRRIAASLDRDVQLYLICNTGNEDSTIQRLLERYEGLSGHIQAQVMDPTRDPTFLDRYDLEISRLYENSVLAVCGERCRLVGYDEIYETSYSMEYSTYSYVSSTSFNGENALTNAIHYVSSASLPKAYILSGHGEAALDEQLEAMLAQDNFDTESLSLLSLEEVPQDAAAIIINAPSSDLSEEEADILMAYLEKDGCMALTTGYIDEGMMPQLLRVTSSMGLTVDTGLIIEGSAQHHLNRYPHYLLPDAESHEITDAIIDSGYYILTPLAQPLVESGEGSATVTWLLTTSDTAYTKAAGLQTATTMQEDGDATGAFHVGAVAEGAGKLFWVTSDELLNSRTDAMVSGGNSNLFMNALNWMGGQEESISIWAKSLDEAGLTVPQSDATLWSVIMIGLIPLALVGIGITIWIRRKRR